jgi:hypothetical protein
MFPFSVINRKTYDAYPITQPMRPIPTTIATLEGFSLSPSLAGTASATTGALGSAALSDLNEQLPLAVMVWTVSTFCVVFLNPLLMTFHGV